MSMNQYVPWKSISTEADRIAYDEALRKFMLQVYNNMSIALAISGLVALGLNFNQTLMTAIWGDRKSTRLNSSHT